MNYFITGATGFVGTHLIDYLSGKKGTKIYALTRSEKKFSERFKGLFNVEQIKGTLFSDFKIPDDTEVIVHIAGLTKTTDYREFYRVNGEGTEAVLKKASELKTLKKFIHISSLSAAGPSKDCTPLSENLEPSPVSHYGKSKLIGERKVLEYRDRINSVILRPPIVYGEWDRDFLETAKLVKKGISLSSVYSRNERHVSIVYVKDLIRAIKHFVEADTDSGEIFYIGEDRIYSWKDIEDEIADVLKVKIRVRVKVPLFILKILAFSLDNINKVSKKEYIINMDKIAEIKERCWVLSNEKAKKFGFKEYTRFSEGIRETIFWAIKKGWL